MDPSTNKIPLGIEVLVNKASVDPDFRQLLIERRAEAAREIGLELEPAEAAMLASIPREQLEIIIDHTEVPRGTRRIFLGVAAAAMITALAAIIIPKFMEAQTQVDGLGIIDRSGFTKGNEPDRPARMEQDQNSTETHRDYEMSKGIRIDRPVMRQDLNSTPTQESAKKEKPDE